MREGTDPADDDLEIRSGGVIAVETGSLRTAAGILRSLAAHCVDVRDLVLGAAAATGRAGLFRADLDAGVDDAGDAASRMAQALNAQADLYDDVERQIAREAAATTVTAGASPGVTATGATGLAAATGAAAGATGSAAAGTVAAARAVWQARLAQAADPETAADAARVLAAWRDGRTAVIDDELRAALAPYLLATGVGALAGLDVVTGLIGAVGRGTIERSEPGLIGADPPVHVRELRRMPVTAPRGLADLARRIPDAPGERVRVEVYEHADRTREYAVYIPGTRDWGLSGPEAWNLASNVELYFGERSAASAAVEQALAAAGAVRGDTVHLVGHSQGGMIATWIAREGRYDVASLVTFGSPVQAELDGVPVVTVRHADDPVVALADGGFPGLAGGAGSVVVERVAAPGVEWGRVDVSVHEMDAYIETATRADRSGDPRMDAGALGFAGLGTAATATAISYAAERREPAAERREPPAVRGTRGEGEGETRGRRVSGASSSGGAGRSRTPS